MIDLTAEFLLWICHSTFTLKTQTLYINTCNLINQCVTIYTGAPVYIETYAVSHVVGEEKK
jgi:hypothetical protein